jgi:zinc D-Ala-D-Ala carboxypeptidase
LSDFKYFRLSDFDCQETGENEMDLDFIRDLDELRDSCGFPFVVTSGYRSREHSIEAKKATPGTHARGIAADIKINNGHERMLIVWRAMEMGFNGIGVAQTFVHVDKRISTPVMWVY